MDEDQPVEVTEAYWEGRADASKLFVLMGLVTAVGVWRETDFLIAGFVAAMVLFAGILNLRRWPWRSSP